MVTGKYEGGSGADSQQADGVRALRRKVKINRTKDNRLLITPGSQIPSENEGFGDTGPGEDEIMANENVPELNIPRPDRAKEKEKRRKQATEFIETRAEAEVPQNTIPASNIKGTLTILSDGTINGTTVMLNGEKLDVKIILNLMIL